MDVKSPQLGLWWIRLVDNMVDLPGAPAWVGPDQTALEQVLAAVGG